MKSRTPLLLSALLLGLLVSCGTVPSEQTIEGLLVLPTGQEYAGNKIDTLHLAPSIETNNGARVSLASSIELCDEKGHSLSWAEVGVGQRATVTYGSDGVARKAVIYGDTNDTIYLWHGEVITDGVSAYFKTSQLTFMYVAEWGEKACPEHVAMKVRGREQFVQDVRYQREGSEIFYSPNPSGFAGYAALDS